MKVKSFKYLLTSISVLILVYHLINMFQFWPEIPERIAIHFTKGEPDNWGLKYFLLVIPLIGLFSWWLIGLLTKRPEKLNYINLTEKNREKQYTMAKKIMILMQNLLFIISIFANESLLRYAAGMENGVFNFFSLFLLAVILISLFFNLIWAATLKE